jgi:hypothetical protein
MADNKILGEPMDIQDPKKRSGKIPDGPPPICLHMNSVDLIGKDPFN